MITVYLRSEGALFRRVDEGAYEIYRSGGTWETYTFNENLGVTGTPISSAEALELSKKIDSLEAARSSKS